MRALATQLLLSAAVGATVVSLPAQPQYQAFVKSFNKAKEFNDANGMDRAVRSNPRWVIYHYESVLTQWLRDKSNEDRRKVLDAVSASFKRVYETNTLDEMKQYFTTLDAEKGAILNKTDMDWYKLQGIWTNTTKAQRRREDMEKVIDQVMAVAKKFEQVGHPLKAANVWATAHTYFEALPNRTLADKRDGVYVIERFIDNRKTWNWTKDPYYLQWVNWMKGQKLKMAEASAEEEKRKKAGFKEQAAGPDAFIVPKAKDEVGTLVFKPLKQLPKDCFFSGGMIPSQWMAVALGAANDTPVHLQWYKKSDVFLVRAGAAKWGVTIDGSESDLSKNPWQRIDAPNKIAKKPTVFYTDKEKKKPYAMWFYTCGTSEMLTMGLNSNLAPQKNRANVYFRSGASWTTTLHGVQLTFLDDNCDGKLFTEDPYEYGLKDYALGFGGKDEVPVPAYDSMIIGKGKPVPFSSWVKLGQKWYHIRQLPAGVGARPVHPDFFKTGTLQMKWVGPKDIKPRLLIMRGKDSFASGAFDISSGKPVEVPAGEYTLIYGRIEKGRGPRLMMAQILQGDSKVIEVKPGKNAVFELGAPFKIDFKKEIDKGQMVIDGMFFKIKGKAGEHYAKVSGAPPAPDVYYGKTKDGKGAKLMGSYNQITNADLLNKADRSLRNRGISQVTINVCYFSVVKGSRDSSTVMRFTLPFPDGFVGLKQNKNKLFGKITPNFK